MFVFGCSIRLYILLFINRWPTRVFATECLQKILVACEGVQANFDLELAREIKMKTSNGEFHLLFM